MRSLKENSLLQSILTGSLIFYGLSGLISLFNYAYYPVISHVVSTTTYGEIQFLMSLFMQLSVGFVALNILSIILTAKHTSIQEQKKALKALNIVGITVILAIVTVGSIVLGLGKDSFGFTSIVPVLMLGLALLTNVPFTVTMGRLQGEQRYIFSGVMGALGAFFRLAFALLFVLIGLGTTGAVAGSVVGMLVALAIVFLYEKRGAIRSEKAIDPERRSLKGLATYYVTHLTHLKDEKALLWTALLAMGAMTVLSTIDVLISKLTLGAHDAGQYAATATVAKIILYATTPLMWLALPLALTNIPEAIRKVRTYIFLTLGIGVVLLVPFSFMSDFIVHNMLGIDAGKYLSLLPLASLAMVIIALAFILVAVSLCRDQLRIAVWASVGSIIGFVTVLGTVQQRGMVEAAIIGQIVGGIIAIIIAIAGNRIYEKDHKPR